MPKVVSQLYLMTSKMKIIMFLLLFSTLSYAKEIRYLTISGQSDPRLSVNFTSWYRSTNLENSDCRQRVKDTGANRPILAVLAETIKDQNYSIKIPIDYVKEGGDDTCAYEFRTAEIKIQRNHDGQKYSQYMLLGGGRWSLHSPKVSRGVHMGIKGNKAKRITVNNHYFLGDNLSFECQTKSINRFNISEDFWCAVKGVDDIQGIDALRSMDLKVNIIIDESKEPFIEVPYIEPKKTWWQKFKAFF